VILKNSFVHNHSYLSAKSGNFNSENFSFLVYFTFGTQMIHSNPRYQIVTFSCFLVFEKKKPKTHVLGQLKFGSINLTVNGKVYTNTFPING